MKVKRDKGSQQNRNQERVTVSYRIPLAVRHQLRVAKAVTEKSMDDIVTEAIAQWVACHIDATGMSTRDLTEE